MSRAPDASSDAGDHNPKVSEDQWSPGDAEAAAAQAGHLEDNDYKPAGKDHEIDLEGGPVERTSDGRNEGIAERAELVAWLKTFADADDRAFTVSEQAEIRHEIQELHAEVRTLVDLNRHQKAAIDQLLAEVQRGSERMGRKDWVTYAIGAATSLVIMEIVPPLVLLPLAVHAIHALPHLLVLDV